MKLGELFSGVGGWSEAARMSGGIMPVFCSEIDKYKNKVYELRHPGVPNFGDIRNISGKELPAADIWTVSFPCTGISVAGKGEGLADKQSGLWFEAYRLLRVCRPRYVVIENSPALLGRGMATILPQLAGLGYDAEWTCLSGKVFGIQQLRKRVYVIAYADQNRQSMSGSERSIFRPLQTGIWNQPSWVFPGWSDRREIPQPRTYRSAYDFPSIIHRLECTGDAIIPVIGKYILDCIKLDAQCV